MCLKLLTSETIEQIPNLAPANLTTNRSKNVMAANKLKMLRKTTPMHAATANKFVNKAEVISVKSERAKKHVLEVVDVRNNQTNS